MAAAIVQGRNSKSTSVDFMAENEDDVFDDMFDDPINQLPDIGDDAFIDATNITCENSWAAPLYLFSPSRAHAGEEQYANEENVVEGEAALAVQDQRAGEHNVQEQHANEENQLEAGYLQDVTREDNVHDQGANAENLKQQHAGDVAGNLPNQWCVQVVPGRRRTKYRSLARHIYPGSGSNMPGPRPPQG